MKIFHPFYQCSSSFSEYLSSLSISCYPVFYEIRSIIGPLPNSRKEIKQSLAKGRFWSTDLLQQNYPKMSIQVFQEVRWKDRILTTVPITISFLHKPQGLVTATKDTQHPTVLDLLRTEDRTPKTYPIGRLDRDTTGLPPT